jgi:transcriptional regulator with XRE-family HTH domain
MQTTEQTDTSRVLTAGELAEVIKLSRHYKQWSQEQLAALSGLSVRTIQRVERGEPSDFDTRRALASALEFEDIDALNKPFEIPTDEKLKAEKEKFDREHITLDALPLARGRELAKLVEMHSMDLSTPGFDMKREAEEEFAALVDYMREYRECKELYSEVQKFDVYDQIQRHIDVLRKHGVSLCYAERKLQIKFNNDDTHARPFRTSALYVIAFPLGKEPKQIVTPREMAMGL